MSGKSGPRKRSVKCALTASELSQIEHNANLTGLSKGAYVRSVILRENMGQKAKEEMVRVLLVLIRELKALSADPSTLHAIARVHEAIKTIAGRP